MQAGDDVLVNLTKPDIQLELVLEEYWPYEPSNYCLAEQWLCFEKGIPQDPDATDYWIQLDGTVYYKNMEIGFCGAVAEFYERPE